MTALALWIAATRLRSETEIRAWGRENGYGTSFRIYDTRPRSITIYSATITKPRPISQKEFLRVAELWPSYRDGTIGREILTAISQNTSYVLGILKCLVDQDESAAIVAGRIDRIE